MVKIRYDKTKKEWIELSKEDEPTDMDITIDGFLYKILLRVKEDLKNDFDHAMLVAGSVGSGKSNAGRIMCRIVSDERFHPRTHIVSCVEDIEPVFTKAKKGDGVLFDESSGIFSATDTMTKKTKYASFVLDVCRQKNLFLVIVAPHFHRLSSNVAVDRTKTMIRTYVDSRTGKRGRFAFYGTRAKEKLYRFAKVNYGSLKGARPKFRGMIGLDKTFLEEYRKVKDATLTTALKSLNKEKEEGKTPHKIIQEHKLQIIKSNMDKSSKELSGLLGVNERTIQRMKKRIKEQ